MPMVRAPGPAASIIKRHFLCDVIFPHTNKTYIWRTNNIEGGSWTQTTLPNLYHDASLLLDDDGRAYLAYGQDTIRLVELNADLSGVKAAVLTNK